MDTKARDPDTNLKIEAEAGDTFTLAEKTTKSDTYAPVEVLTTLEQRYDDEAPPKVHGRAWLILFACIILWLGAVLGLTSTGYWLVPALHKIGSGVPGPGLWFSQGSLIVKVALSPIFGLVSDFSPQFRKFVTLGLTIAGSIGTFVLASSHHLDQGIIGDCLFGLSLTAQGPSAAIVADVFPRRMRGLTQGLLAGLGATNGAFIAVVAGGALVKHVDNNNGWRWPLYLSGILQVLGCVLLYIFYRPEDCHSDGYRIQLWNCLRNFDWLGSILFCAGIIPLMMALIWAHSTYPWNTPPCIATVTIGACFLTIFAVHQTVIKKDGILNHQLFRNRNFALSLVATFIDGVTYITWNIYLSQQIGTLYTSDPILLGLHFGILLLCSEVSILAWCYYTKRFREVKLPLVTSFVSLTAAAAGLSQLQPFGQSQSRAAWALCAFVGLSYGGSLPLILAVTQLAVAPELTGVASSLSLATRALGGALAPAIGNAIFSAKISTFLPKYIARSATQSGVSSQLVPKLVTAIAKGGLKVATLPGISANQIKAAHDAYLQAYADAFAYIHYSIIPWTAFGALMLCGLKSVKKEMNWQIDRPIIRTRTNAQSAI